MLLGLRQHLVELRQGLRRPVVAELRQLGGVVEQADGLAGRAHAVDGALAERVPRPAELLQRPLTERLLPAERVRELVERRDETGLDQLAVDAVALVAREHVGRVVPGRQQLHALHVRVERGVGLLDLDVRVLLLERLDQRLQRRLRPGVVLRAGEDQGHVPRGRDVDARGRGLDGRRLAGGGRVGRGLVGWRPPCRWRPCRSRRRCHSPAQPRWWRESRPALRPSWPARCCPPLAYLRTRPPASDERDEREQRESLDLHVFLPRRNMDGRLRVAWNR